MNKSKLNYDTVLEMVQKTLKDDTVYHLAASFTGERDGKTDEQITAALVYEAIKNTSPFYLEDLAVVKLQRQDAVLKEGNIYDVREQIETLLEEETGLFVSLQESFESCDDEYTVYLHSEAFDDLTDDEIEQLCKLDLDTDNNIFKLLNINVTFSHYDLEHDFIKRSSEKYLPWVEDIDRWLKRSIAVK